MTNREAVEKNNVVIFERRGDCMKEYWPMAIIKNGNEWEIQHTYECALSYEKAVDQIKIWRVDYSMKILKWWIDITEKGEKVESTTPYVYPLFVKELWEDFGDVPMNPETECIEDFWGKFYPGTHREEIWHWFEETFNVIVAKDLM